MLPSSRLYLVLTLCFISLWISAQELPILQRTFHHIDRTSGLPSLEVNYLLEDDLGFIWMATNNGLCRYDGQELKVWKASDSIPGSLQSSVILSLACDKQGWIWANTELGGLNAYNPKMNKWYHWGTDTTLENGFMYNSPATVFAAKDGSIWCSSMWYLHHISKTDTGISFQSFEMALFSESKKPLMIINEIIEDSATGNLWLATGRGLVGFDRVENKFLYSQKQLANNDPPGITRLLISQQGYFYAGLYDGGLARVRAEGVKPGYEFESMENLPDGFKKQRPRKISQAASGEIFISGYGILKIDESQEELELEWFYKIPNLPQSLPHTIVKHVIKDKAGNWWTASHNGVGVYYPNAPDFQIISSQTLNDENFDNRIYRVFKDSRGWLWFGGQDGLYVTKSECGNPQRIMLEGNIANEPGFVAGIDEGINGEIWVAVAPYLYKIDPQNLSFQQIKVTYPRPELNNLFLMNLKVDDKGLVFIPGIGGIPFYNEAQNSWDNHRPEYASYFYGLGFLDDQHYVTADNAVLYIINTEESTLEIIEKDGQGKNKQPYLQGIKNFMLEDSVAYISQQEKLVTYDFRTEKWSEYSETEGLTGGRVLALAVDTKGKIWLSTDMGIARFDPINKKVETLALVPDIPVSQFNSRAGWAGDGRVYFGTDKGIVHFNEDALRQNEYEAPVYITGISVYNKSVPVISPSVNKGIPVAPEYLDQLSLSSNQNMMSLRFAALNFHSASQNRYAFRLKGFADEWIEVENSHQATFTNLDPGEYQFEVKTANSSGIWSSQVATLNLQVIPPWYKTWWAMLFFGFLIVIILFYIWRLRLQAVREKMLSEARVEKARIEEREEFRKRSAADFHDEAGNKLTKINLFTSLAREQQNGNAELNNYLFKIEQNTKELLAGMRDFLWVMDPTRDSLFDTISRLKTFGESMFDDTHTTFSISGLRKTYHDIPLSMDVRRAIMQIFKEGMNNCAKHACAKKLVLRVSLEGQKLSLCLEDDGKGFDPSLKKEGSYGHGIMNERAERIGANLQTLSKEGIGTKLCLDYKIPQMSEVSD
ncbi:sensor histidine kinase [Owenweeksia hongkongensis]|nr:sensor histidine kinase [Owenweeksia hongkongensis]